MAMVLRDYGITFILKERYQNIISLFHIMMKVRQKQPCADSQDLAASR